MTHMDYAMAALCLWREARGEGERGMAGVGWVLRNRVARRGSCYFAEVVRPWQFSSMTAKGDPQVANYPAVADPSWALAQQVAAYVIEKALADPTGGATLYYDDSIAFPKSWDRAKVQATVKIGRLNFYREV
jgi:spore germination cell wall hydrolase CwlJ-like protein